MAWSDYLAKSDNKKISPLLLEAIGLTKNHGQALDLGAGALAESKYLLEQGFEVTAVDSSPEVEKYAKGLGGHFHLKLASFDQYNFPPNTFDLVNARYALPFNPPNTFGRMFERLKASLKSNGIFVGEFFGPEDSWVGRAHMTFHSRSELEYLLQPLEIISLNEEKREGSTASGKIKIWHVFHVITRKI